MTEQVSPNDQKYLRDLSRQVGPEARLYARIIPEALRQLGQSFAPSQVKQRGKRPGGRKLQRVEFDRIYINPEVIYFRIRSSKKTLLGSVSGLPNLVTIQDLMNDDICENLAFACKRNVSWVWDRSHPERGAWYLVHRLEGVGGIPKHVPFMETLECYPKDMSRLPLVLGSTTNRTVHTIFLGENPHLMIAGPTQCGKSNAANSFILAMMYYNKPSDLQFLLIDLKERIEFRDYMKSPHLAHPVVGNIPEALQTLTFLKNEVERRMVLLNQSSLKDWHSYRQAKGISDPYLVCVIDEYAQLVLPYGREVAEQANTLITRIGSLGRAVGVQLIVCTQYPTGEVINRQIKINLNNAIGFKCMNTVQSSVILGVGNAAYLPNDVKGRALYTSGAELVEVQIPYVRPDDTTWILKQVLEQNPVEILSQEVPIDQPETMPATEAQVDMKRWVIEKADPREWDQERIIHDPSAATAYATLFQDYREWASAKELRPIGSGDFAKALNQLGYVMGRAGHDRQHTRIGVKLRPAIITRTLRTADSADASEYMSLAGDR